MYESNPYRPTRDCTNVREVAGQRPALAARIHTTSDWKTNDAEQAARMEEYRLETERADSSIRGSSADNRCGEFNAALRRGAHGDR